MTDTDTLRKRTETDLATIDIVKLLRSPANVFYEYAADNGGLLKKAADEITALREKVKAQQEALKPFATLSPVSWALEADMYYIDTDDIRRAAQEAGNE